MNKTIFNITALIIMSLASAMTSADPADVNLSKSSLNVDFNKLIDEGAHSKKQIQQHIDASIAITDEEDAATMDKSRVLDFVDAEMKVGTDSPTVVDRRYNSVGLYHPIDLQLLVPNYLN